MGWVIILDGSVSSKIQHQHFLILVRAFFCTKNICFVHTANRIGSGDKANSALIALSTSSLYLLSLSYRVNKAMFGRRPNLLSRIGPTTAINRLRMVQRGD